MSGDSVASEQPCRPAPEARPDPSRYTRGVRTQVINPLQDDRWRRAVADAPSASVFHHPAWLSLLRDQYDYEVSACCVLDDAGGLVAGIPLAHVRSRITGSRLVALPFSDLCPPLRLRDAERVDELLACATDRLRGDRRTPVEVRAPLPALPGARVKPGHYHHLVHLDPDPARVEANYSKSQVRRGIAKARREGLTAERTAGPAALDEFYRLHVQTRRRQGVPVQPKRFIRSFDRLFEQGLGFVMLTRLGERTVAAAVFLHLHGTLTYKYGASDARFLSTRPNNLLFSEVIRWGCGKGFHTLDLGRTDLDNAGLRAFKRGWGAEESILSYTFAPPPRHRAMAGRGGRVARAVVRRGPPWVGRLAGELLYRHFG
jgi:CelD/BcsL family acetyltransferase involved in cellulose biosynthesis